MTRIVARVADQMDAESCRRYFGNPSLLTWRGKRLEVRVSSRFMADLLLRRYGTALTEAARVESGEPDAGVEFVVETAPIPADPGEARPSAPAEQRSADRPRVQSRRQQWASLDDFVVGESNRLAHNAAMAISTPDSSSILRLFVHGQCGLGKTHALQGTARRFKELNPAAIVRYTTGEAFTNEFIAAVRAGPAACEKFRRQYRAVDLLCIDDVHFLANKQATQSELLHTFDAIDLSGARVVLASDGHPRQISRFSEALVSRFMAGMVVEIRPPERELRERLVRRIAQRRGLPMEEAAVKAIAELAGPPAARTPASIRELEGMVTRVEAVWRLMPASDAGTVATSIGLVTVRTALLGDSGAASGRPRRPVRVAHIILAACEMLGVEKEDFTGRGRHKRVVLARSIVSHLARRLTTASFPEIAREMGRPNHSTIVTAVQRFEGQLAAGSAAGLESDLAGVSLTELCDRIGTQAAAMV
ncbi:MAG: hypothetical protein KF745_06930 [Phycisphaeraceae bacterium]|nr:hypothetical protein [Phycisphaeraceae bacterium]